MKKLYIIGNGFDLYHGLPSSYYSFRDYVKIHDPELFDRIEMYLYPTSNSPEANLDLWKNFEESLGNLDDDKLRDFARNYLIEYGDDDWSEDYNFTYQRSLSEITDSLNIQLRDLLRTWIQDVDKVLPNKNRIPLDKDAKYLSFNYTHTLENLYELSKDILHIHGLVSDENSQLTLGHSQEPKPQRTEEDIKNSMSAESYEEYKEERAGDDPRIYEGEDIISEYWENSYKNTSKIISENQFFFDDLKDIEEIHVIGLSFSPIDLDYLHEVCRQTPNAKWYVSFHTLKEKEEFREVLINILGVKENNIQLFHL